MMTIVKETLNNTLSNVTCMKEHGQYNSYIHDDN